MVRQVHSFGGMIASRSRIPIRLRLAALALLPGCVSSTGGCDCVPAGRGIVTGTVTRANAGAVSGAVVRVEARLKTCARTEPNLIAGAVTTSTDPQGKYTFEINASVPTDSACIRVVARTIAGNDSAVADGAWMRLVSSATPVAPVTLRVDLTLP